MAKEVARLLRVIGAGGAAIVSQDEAPGLP
jgi:hypothetical protein